jgi:16S rRNA (guanine527-N7)-methyltransferase
MSLDAHTLWTTLARDSGRELSDSQINRLEIYLDQLIAANKVMNLTRITDRTQAQLSHVADALTLLKHIPAGTSLLADVGSGGGVPGMVLAIALPETRVVLIESTQKKARFLADTATVLGLENLSVRAIRAEEAGRGDLREACDVVTARAVGAMVFLVEWCLPLVKVGGKLLAMKGPRLAEELPAARTAIRLLGGADGVVHPVTGLPEASGHVICEVVKRGRTPEKYPRSPDIAKGKAIGSPG